MHLDDAPAVAVILTLETENRREAQEAPESRYTDSCKRWQLPEIEK